VGSESEEGNTKCLLELGCYWERRAEWRGIAVEKISIHPETVRKDAH
jgi:hypothetical protein